MGQNFQSDKELKLRKWMSIYNELLTIFHLWFRTNYENIGTINACRAE